LATSGWLLVKIIAVFLEFYSFYKIANSQIPAASQQQVVSSQIYCIFAKIFL